MSERIRAAQAESHIRRAGQAPRAGLDVMLAERRPEGRLDSSRRDPW